MEQREEAFQDFDLRNVLIKYMTSGTFKRVLYDMRRSSGLIGCDPGPGRSSLRAILPEL